MYKYVNVIISVRIYIMNVRIYIPLLLLLYYTIHVYSTGCNRTYGRSISKANRTSENNKKKVHVSIYFVCRRL